MATRYNPALEEEEEEDNNSNLSLSGTHYNSYGFIDVGEAPTESGGYKLRRSRSTDFNIETLLERQQLMEQELTDLKLEFERFKQAIHKWYKAENNQWTVRYSRRLCVLAHFGVGLMVFWKRFTEFMRRRKGQLIQGVMKQVPVLPKLKQNAAKHTQKDLGLLVIRAFQSGILHSIVFFIASYFISKRNSPIYNSLGIITSICALIGENSFIFGRESVVLPFGIAFFTMLTNLIFIAAWISSIRERDSLMQLPGLFNEDKQSTTKKNNNNNNNNNSNGNLSPRPRRGSNFGRNDNFGSSRTPNSPVL
eukprot:TRINITY_DN7332_c0_g1_i1.p1 TRINITY_DN7332_c0_g1~~TRINITY_DN7332_c0_g1_i1.p1  ORF type:complete len:307 (-),score=77.08 TRINITY_DN7332_c0_g1_i1:39-959(-)